jgi:hypothetical protein
MCLVSANNHTECFLKISQNHYHLSQRAWYENVFLYIRKGRIQYIYMYVYIYICIYILLKKDTTYRDSRRLYLTFLIFSQYRFNKDSFSRSWDANVSFRDTRLHWFNGNSFSHSVLKVTVKNRWRRNRPHTNDYVHGVTSNKIFAVTPSCLYNKVLCFSEIRYSLSIVIGRRWKIVSEDVYFKNIYYSFKPEYYFL